MFMVFKYFGSLKDAIEEKETQATDRESHI